MTTVGPEMTNDDLGALRERKRLFDDVWLLTLFVIFIALATPWFLRILDVDFAPLAWSLFGFGLVYVAGSMATDRVDSRRNLFLIVGVLQALGVIFLGFLWHLTGGLQNPLFLLVFVMPVIAGSLVSLSWQSYLTALLAVIVVALVALIEAPELRWYLIENGIPVQGLIKRLPEPAASASQPFPSFSAPASYFVVVLELFAVFLFAVALMTESLNTLLRRLYGRLGYSMNALNEAESRSQEVLRASPFPAALIYADTFKVEQASQSFMHHLMLRRDSLLTKNLFDLINFSYPEVVQELIEGTGGELPFAVYRVATETRMARIRVYPIHHSGVRYAYVSVEDMSDLYYLQAAFNAVDEALIVVGANQRILYFNQTAQILFGALHFGIEAGSALKLSGLPDAWWVLGLRTSLERQIELDSKRYRIHCVVVDIPGEHDKLTIVSLRAVDTPQ
jgi:PAS domain-containing protein